MISRPSIMHVKESFWIVSRGLPLDRNVPRCRERLWHPRGSQGIRSGGNALQAIPRPDPRLGNTVGGGWWLASKAARNPGRIRQRLPRPLPLLRLLEQPVECFKRLLLECGAALGVEIDDRAIEPLAGSRVDALAAFLVDLCPRRQADPSGVALDVIGAVAEGPAAGGVDMHKPLQGASDDRSPVAGLDGLLWSVLGWCAESG